MNTRKIVLFNIVTFALLMAGCGSPNLATSISNTATAPSITPTSTQTVEDQLAFQINYFLTSLADSGRFSGSVLVAKNSQVLISQGYGMANLELGVPNTPETKFRIGSITKQFTAMAILELQQQGKLDVQDPICQYLDDCPEAWQPITIHQLLTHTSGIPNANAGADEKHPVTPTQILEGFRKLPLDFTPSESWSYSNSGYMVLGYILEKVSDQPYATFLEKNIFEPLHMTNTGFDNNRKVIKNRAASYANSYLNAEYIDMSVPYAAGGLYSTTEDLFLWDEALYSDQLISSELRDQMLAPLAKTSDPKIGYGYGWFTGEKFNQQWVGHEGRMEGFRSIIVRYLHDKVVIIILGNRDDVNLADIETSIAQFVFGEK